MNESKQGRPKKYATLIAGLNDEQIYSPSGIAYLFANPRKKRKEYDRARIALSAIGRRHGFKKEGDGTVSASNGSKVIGWKGKVWKSILSREELLEALAKREIELIHAHLPVPNLQCEIKTNLIFAHFDFLTTLEAEQCFSVDQIMALAKREGVHDGHQEHPKSIEHLAFVKKLLRDYSRSELPGKPDAHIKVFGTYQPAFFGWRWQLALPEEVFDYGKKYETMHRVFHNRIPLKEVHFQKATPQPSHMASDKSQSEVIQKTICGITQPSQIEVQQTQETQATKANSKSEAGTEGPTPKRNPSLREKKQVSGKADTIAKTRMKYNSPQQGEEQPSPPLMFSIQTFWKSAIQQLGMLVKNAPFPTKTWVINFGLIFLLVLSIFGVQRWRQDPRTGFLMLTCFKNELEQNVLELAGQALENSKEVDLQPIKELSKSAFSFCQEPDAARRTLLRQKFKASFLLWGRSSEKEGAFVWEGYLFGTKEKCYSL